MYHRCRWSWSSTFCCYGPRLQQCFQCTEANHNHRFLQVSYRAVVFETVSRICSCFVCLYVMKRGYSIWQNAYSAKGGIVFGGVWYLGGGGLCPAPRPRGVGVSAAHLCPTSPKRGTPWVPKTFIGSGRQAQSPNPPSAPSPPPVGLIECGMMSGACWLFQNLTSCPPLVGVGQFWVPGFSQNRGGWVSPPPSGDKHTPGAAWRLLNTWPTHRSPPPFAHVPSGRHVPVCFRPPTSHRSNAAKGSTLAYTREPSGIRM